jgi:hypothetical protein
LCTKCPNGSYSNQFSGIFLCGSLLSKWSAKEVFTICIHGNTKYRCP